MTISPLLFIGLICLAGGGSLLPAKAIWLTIPSSGERCVYEMIQANVVVVGDYLCIDQDNVGLGPTIDIHVCLHKYQLLFTTILHILRCCSFAHPNDWICKSIFVLYIKMPTSRCITGWILKNSSQISTQMRVSFDGAYRCRFMLSHLYNAPLSYMLETDRFIGLGYISSVCGYYLSGNITSWEGTIQENKRDAWSVCIYNERDRNILCLFVVSSWSVTLHSQWHCYSQSWLEDGDSNQRLGCCC